VPTTWAETLAAAKKIGSDNPSGFGVGLSQSQNADSLAELFCCLMISAGGVMFNPNGTTAINGDAGVMAFQWIADLFNQGGTSKAAINYTYFTLADGLAASTIAMTVLGSQRIAAVAATAKDDAGFAPPPGWSASKPGQSNPLSQTLVLSKTSKHKEEAIQFIEFMTGPKAAAELAKGGEVPPRKSSYTDPFFASPAAANVSRLKEILLQRGGHVPSYPARYWNLKQLLAEAAQSMVLQKRAPKEVLDEAAKKYNAQA
jgi:ABC-type glycerol-3-phosphate transport system substrate-binding protein